ncbi:MAG: ABC transporter substrate-binding protein [Planctomycetota bacterium]
MSERSTVTNILLAFLLVAACAGVYFVIDSQDFVRQGQLQTQRAIEENTKEIRSLRMLLEGGRFALQGANPGAPVGGEGHPRLPFNNSDLEDPEAEDGGERVSSVMSFSGNLNTVINNEATVADLWGYCNDSLGSRNAKDPKRFEPRMAEWWEVSPDGKVITVKLRPRILWHDFKDPVTGREWKNVPVTARDFAFYIDTIRNPNLPCDPIRNYYQDLDRIEVLDDLTFRAIWKKTYFLSLESTLSLSPLPRHLYRPDPETSDEAFAEDMLKDKAARNQVIVGCGPYRFAEYRKGDRIVLLRNENFFGPLPHIKRLEIREIKDPEKTLIEFTKGALDLIGLTAVQWVEQTPPPDFLTVCDDVDRAEELTREHDARKKAAFREGGPFGENRFEKYLYRSFAYNFIAWNMRKPLFSDRRVRLALTHCIDRERIIREVFFNLAVPTTGNFVPHSLYYDSSIRPWPFDIEKAKAMLAEAGWSDTDGDGVLDKDLDADGARDPFEFTFLMIANHPYQSKWVPMIQQDLQKAGIRMKVKSAEWSLYTQELDEFAFDACSFSWRGGIESDPYQLWHSSQADIKSGSNVCGLKNAEADRLIEEGRRTLDLDRRIAVYQRFHRLLHEEQPYTFLSCGHAMTARSKRYCNMIVYPLGMVGELHWVPKSMQRQE